MFYRKTNKNFKVITNDLETCQENFKSIKENFKSIKEDLSEIYDDIDDLYDLQEKLGDKFKNDKISSARLFANLLRFLDLSLDDEGNVIKNKTKKNETVSTPRKANKRKSK